MANRPVDRRGKKHRGNPGDRQVDTSFAIAAIAGIYRDAGDQWLAS